MKRVQRKGLRGRHQVAMTRATRLAHVALALWFAYFAWGIVSGTLSDWPAHLDTVGIDGRLYYRAAATFVAGGDPWTATSAQTLTNTWPPSGQLIHFAFTGPPPTVLAFVPFVWIPEWIFFPLWMGLTLTAAVYTIRRLRLPIYWLLFPPLVQGVSVGNPQIVCLALLLCGSSWLRALAAPMKAYAVVPMIGERQWRALGLLIVAGAISVLVFWPLWAQYFKEYSTVQDWLIGATHWDPDRTLYAAAAVALAALACIDLRAAAWLATAALWPGGQFFYLSFILPAAPVLAPFLTFNGWRSVPIIPPDIADRVLGMNNLFQLIVAYVLIRLALHFLKWVHRRGWLDRAGRAIGIIGAERST